MQQYPTMKLIALRLVGIGSYVLAFAFLIMAIVDEVFSLSRPVIEFTILAFDSAIKSHCEFGYSAYYVVAYLFLWLLSNTAMTRVDIFEKDQRLLPSVIIQ